MKWTRSLVVALAVTTALATATMADSLWVSTLERSNIRIKEVRNGQVYYEINGRMAQPIDLDKVTRIEVDNEPILTRAEEAFASGKWNDAAEQYQKAIQTSRQTWVKAYATPRLLEASSKAGRFDTATTAFIQMVLNHPETALKYKPAVPTGDDNALKSSVAEINRTLSDSRANLSDEQRQQLLLFLLDINRSLDDTAAVDAVANQLVELSKTLPDGDPAAIATLKLGLAQAALSNQDYQKAIDQIQSARELFVDQKQMAAALYVVAQAKFQLAEKSGNPNDMKDAGIAFMEIVANFKDHSDWPMVAQSLYMTGQTMLKLNDTKAASEIFQQVTREYSNQPAAASARDALAQLKAQTSAAH